LREEFNAFLAKNSSQTSYTSGSPGDREALFRQFLDWRNGPARR
jgi:hypothetical protein